MDGRAAYRAGDLIMRRFWIGGAVAACLVGMASWANAATVLLTYAGRDFLNQPFTASFQIDTNQGERFDNGWLSEVRGLGQATLATASFTLTSPANSYVELIYVGGHSARAAAVWGDVLPSSYSYINMQMLLYSPLVPQRVDTPFSATGTGNGTAFVEVVTDRQKHICNPCGGFDGAIESLSALATPSAPRTGGVLDEPFTTAVPEPASWVMLLLGLSALGGALRSRRGLAARS